MADAHVAAVDPGYSLAWMDGDLAFCEAALDEGRMIGLSVAFEHDGEVVTHRVRAPAHQYESERAQGILKALVEQVRHEATRH